VYTNRCLGDVGKGHNKIGSTHLSKLLSNLGRLDKDEEEEEEEEVEEDEEEEELEDEEVVAFLFFSCSGGVFLL
jgi:hypothetical protein